MRVAVLGCFASMLTLPTAYAADGDNLAAIHIDRTGTACADGASGIGVGLAFDGTNLLASCYSDNTITANDPADGSLVAIHSISGSSALGALAWDQGRGLLWACSNSSTVGTIDLTTNVFTPAFPSEGCFDGLAYDGVDDTLWASADANTQIRHYNSAGVLLTSQALSLGGYGNSGIAVGGSSLYLANNGGSQIYVAPTDLSSVSLFASFPARLEDLECDDITFADDGVGAIWSIDAYDNDVNAWEIPAGSCSFGGGGGGPEESSGGKVTGGGRLELDDGAVTFGTVAIADEEGAHGNLQVNDHVTGDAFHGSTVDILFVLDNVASWAGDGRWNGENGYRYEVTVVDNRNGNSTKKGSSGHDRHRSKGCVRCRHLVHRRSYGSEQGQSQSSLSQVRLQTRTHQ